MASLNPRLAHWPGRVAWLLGASSGIGRATASRLHALGASVVVSARNVNALQAFVAAHPGSMCMPLDAADAPALQSAAELLRQRFGGIDLAMYCAGHYAAQRATAFDLAEMLRHQQVNYVGALHMLDAVLPAMQRAGRGHLSLMGSVAGYRGLPNGLAYGPTKAALINLAETLYLDLAPLGLGVSVINPGFVDTPLTAQNRFRMPALLTPEQAAAEIVAGWEAGRFEIHFPRRFTWWLKVLQHMGHGWYFSAVRRATGL
jgi:NAD(P)-dependent dehydrogenase (short-subunit alcohol dehydrogenase family)